MTNADVKQNMHYKRLLQKDKDIFTRVRHAADKLGYPVYVIGGYVRNRLLGLPSADIDFVCEGSGIALAKEFAKQLNPLPDVAVFKNFGTAMLKYGDYDIEFVGARKESYSRNSRKPVVEDGTIDDDMRRRDFTINALAINLNETDYGKLVDLFGGLKDLKNKIIRTPLEPGVTFSDDPLRMLRAIRFAAQLQFKIEDRTLQAIITHKLRIEIVSQERISEELNKILLTSKPSVGFRLLFETGLLEIIFPELAALQGVDVKDGLKHKDNFFHTLQVVDNIAKKTDNLWLRWSALLHDIAKPDTKKYDEKTGWTFHGHETAGARMVPKIFRRFRLPQNEKMQFVKKLVLLHLRPIGLVSEEVTDSAIRRLLFEAGDDIDSLMLLCEADITSKNEYKVKNYLRNFEALRNKLREVEENDKLRNWKPPVTGEVIMETFGITPGKEVGIIKNAIKDAILDGLIGNNYEDAYNFMLRMGEKLGLQKKKNNNFTTKRKR